MNYCSMCGHDNVIIHLPALSRTWYLCEDCFKKGEEE